MYGDTGSGDTCNRWKNKRFMKVTPGRLEKRSSSPIQYGWHEKWNKKNRRTKETAVEETLALAFLPKPNLNPLQPEIPS